MECEKCYLQPGDLFYAPPSDPSGFQYSHISQGSQLNMLIWNLWLSWLLLIHLPLKRRVFKTAITEYKIWGFPNSLISTLNPAEVSILHSNLWFSSWGQRSEQDSQEQDEQGGEEDCTGVRQPKQTGKPSGRLHKTKNNKKLLIVLGMELLYR